MKKLIFLILFIPIWGYGQSRMKMEFNLEYSKFTTAFNVGKGSYTPLQKIYGSIGYEQFVFRQLSVFPTLSYIERGQDRIGLKEEKQRIRSVNFQRAQLRFVPQKKEKVARIDHL